MNSIDREREHGGDTEIVGLQEQFPLLLEHGQLTSGRKIGLQLEFLRDPLLFSIDAPIGLRVNDRSLCAPYDESEEPLITSEDFDLQQRIIRDAQKGSSYVIADQFPRQLAVEGVKESFRGNGVLGPVSGEMRMGRVGVTLPKRSKDDQGVMRVEMVVFVPEKGLSYISSGNGYPPIDGKLDFHNFVPLDVAGAKLPLIPAPPMGLVIRQLPPAFKLRFPDNPDVLSTLEGMFIQRAARVQFPRGVRKPRM